MKLIKKSVSLLLVLCMVLSFVPMNVFADTGDNDSFGAADGFYKIVHLDAGRKYISVENVKKYIDAMASEGYNQLTLYFSDNQGFRFKLDDDDMSLIVNGTDYTDRFISTIGNGYNQPADGTGTGDWFRHSLEPDGTKNYYTEEDMNTIITYANSKGIDLVPAFDMPGHMGAILEVFTEFRYTGSSSTSWSTLDVDNETARDFALAILQKYVDFFKDAGCDYFSICADEFCYDTGSANIKTETLANIMLFMDEAAKIIDDAGMIPRCFNDWLYSSTAYTPSEDYGKYEVYYWGNRGYATPADLIAKGHPIINTGESAYYALGSNWYSEAGTDAGVKAFDPYVIATKGGDFPISNPAGVCFAIWCDRGHFDSATAANTGAPSEPAGGDGGKILFSETEGYLRIFAQSVRERGPQEVNVKLAVGDEYDQTFGPYEGELDAAAIAALLGLQGHVTASSITVTPGTPGTPGTDGGDVDTSSALTALTAGTKVVLGDGTNFLVNNNGTLGVGTLANATQWDVVAHDASFDFVSDGKYLYVDTSDVNAAAIATLSDSAPGVPFNIVNGVVKQAWWPSNAVKINGVGEVVAYAVSSGTPATPGTPATTTFKLKGATVGTETFTYNGAQYTINVTSGEHTHDSNVAATCIKGASCSQCGAEQSTTLNENNHAGPVSTATCAAPATCDACKNTVGEKNSANHVGGTEVRGYIAPTETTKGYSGDTYCLGCNTMTVKGTDLDPVHTHTGGVATCINKAVCSTCGEEYGALDGTNHMGDRYVTNITATNTGTIYCSDCNGWIANGENIPNDPTAIYVTVPANGTAGHTVDGALGNNGATGNTVDGLASYSVSIAETSVGGTGTGTYTAFDPTTLAVGSSQEVIFQAGTTTNYMTSTGYNTTDITAAGKWTITRVESGYTISCNGTYINTVGQVVAAILNGTADSVFQWDGSCFYFTSGGYNYYLFANAEYTWWVWYSPVNKGTPMVEGTSGGSGETVTKTTVTFTGGPTNGNDEVTIGGQKFIITVTGGNNPVIEGVNCEHEWEQKHDANGHWQYCAKCMTSTTKAAHSGGNATCEELAVCSTCNQTYGELAAHDYSEATCQTLATCSVCGATTGELGKHTGGSANCQSGAICSICSTEYTDKNTNNHVGPMVEVEGTYVAPTDDTDGKEADKTCSVCHVTVPGAVIPSLNSNVVEITVATGATHQFVISGKDATSLITQGDTNIASASGNFDPGQADKPEVAPQPVTALVSSGTYVFSDGSGNYMTYGNPPGNTTAGLDAHQWIITENSDGTYSIKSATSDEYLYVANWESGTIRLTNNASSSAWTYDSATMTFSMVASDAAGATTYVLSYSESTGWKGIVNGTPAVICTPGTPFEAGHPSSTTITITGVTEGVTYITVDGTRYKINVVDAALLNAKIEVPTWATNRRVGSFKDTAGNKISFNNVITAADNINLVTENGVALEDLVPARGVTDTEGQGSTASEVVYWRGMRHATGNVQGKNTDFHQVGDRILYIRYLNGKWEGSFDRTEWLDLTGYTLDVYYLQETAVTKEVITEVVDWGIDYDNDDGMWAADTYVLLDFAVALDGVGRHPALSGFPNAGDGTTVANQKTIAFHCATGYNDEKVAEGTYPFRRVDTIYAEETMQYEVYMITVTRTSDDPAVQFAGNNPSAVENYTYNGEEKIIWTIDEATYEEKVGQTTTDGKTLGAFEPRPADFDITSTTAKYTMYRTVGGRPVVDYVQIYQNQGLLVTYYVRAKKTEDALTVHYRLEGSSDDFHKYYIAVEQGNYFNTGFNDDPNNEETGLMNNTVTNFYGNTHTVTSNLSDLFDVPSQYRTGMYQFNQHIDFVLEDGTVVNQENYSESMGEIKEVILYYGMDNTHFVPVDFGHHLTIDKDFFKHHVDEYFTINSITVLPSPMTGYFHKYGNLTPYDEDHDGTYESYGYMPYYILDGHEDAYGFTLNMTDTVTGETATETHYVVFFPATTVYYEEFFMIRENALGGNWQIVQDGNEVSLSAFDYETDHQQDICHADTKDIYNYGRDDGINRENGPSNGTELVAMDSSAYAEFVVSGTGIEIYANSTPATSNAAVLIYSGTGSSKTLYKMFVVDTRLKEDENATSATDQIEEIDSAYNVPIVSVLDMPYGTYTVRIGYVTSSAERTDGFRFDGFRVLEPLQNDYALPSADGYTAGYVYEEHHELDPLFYDMRDAVLAKATIPESYEGDYADQIGGEIQHQVFSASADVKAIIIDKNSNNIISGDEKDKIIVDLLDNGPKNEIYLWPGQAIVFTVNDSYNLQVGMKALNGSVDAKYFVSGANGVPTETSKTIDTSTDMFYPMIHRDGTPNDELTGDTVVITNNSTSGVLAITMLKCLPLQFSNTGIDPLMPLSEIDYTRALVAMGYAETPVEDVPGEGQPEDTADVAYVGNSLSLKGDISLNFYYNLSEKVLNDANAYVQFTVNGEIQTVPVSDGILDESDGSYGFSVKLNAKNMGDDVTAQFYTSEGAVGDSKTTSVKAYADYAIANSSKETLVDLMKAMLNYGAAAQVEFGYNADMLVNADLADKDKILPESVDVNGYAHSLTGGDDGITVIDASLLLQSETRIRIYFKLAEGKSIDDYTFTVDGQKVIPVATNDEYYIEKTNIASKDLDTIYTFAMGGWEMTYCGLSYVNQVQKYASDNTDLLNLAKALVVYNQAANAYFG